MTRAGRRLTADITRAIQQECGVSKSAALSDIIGPVCELAAGRAKTGKRIRRLEKSVAALMRSEAAPPLPRGTGFAPLTANDYVTELRRVTAGPPVNGVPHPSVKTWRAGNGQEAQ